MNKSKCIGAAAMTVLLLGCTASLLSRSPIPNTDEQKIIEGHIEENIDLFSLELPKVGGSFYVTKITWEEKDVAVVEYEDGHNAYTVRLKAEMKDESVTITPL